MASLKTSLDAEEGLTLLVRRMPRWASCLAGGSPGDVLAASREMVGSVARLDPEHPEPLTGVQADQVLQAKLACRALLDLALEGQARSASLADLAAGREQTSVYGPEGSIVRKDSRLSGRRF
jgi:hypothetical protein